jgi:uncharacterized DUF497 family protein
MEFEWDEEKNKENQKKHGIPFKNAVDLFDAKNAITKRSHNSGNDDERWLKTASVDGKLITAIFTCRGKSVRIMSIRSARDAEKREYCALYG